MAVIGGVIQCISGRNVVYCDPMNNVCFQQSLYRPVKRDPVIHIAHFFLDITFCQREPLVKQNRNNGYSLGALFLSPFSLNISIALIMADWFILQIYLIIRKYQNKQIAWFGILKQCFDMNKHLFIGILMISKKNETMFHV